MFTALAGSAKAILSYRMGKRDGDNCRAFLADLRDRVMGELNAFVGQARQQDDITCLLLRVTEKGT